MAFKEIWPASWTGKKSAHIAPMEDVFLSLKKWPKEAFETHYHEAFNWLIPLSSGGFWVKIEDEEVHVSSMQWICIFPFTQHEVTRVKSGTDVLSMFLPIPMMRKGFQFLEVNAEITEQPLPKYWIGDRITIAQGFAMQWSEYRAFKDLHKSPWYKSFEEFLAPWLWNFYGKDPQLFEELDRKVVESIEPFLSESPFPWEVVAKKLEISQRTLQRKIKEDTGLTPTEFLHRMKIEIAKDRLIRTKKSIQEIALDCGFASQSHFSTAFKSLVGTTPSEYRSSSTRA